MLRFGEMLCIALAFECDEDMGSRRHGPAFYRAFMMPSEVRSGD